MGNALPITRRTADEFLRWEAEQAVKHEFVGGEVFAMAGAELRHATVALNVAMALRRGLAGSPCRTFIADVKLRVERADAYFVRPEQPVQPPAGAR